MKNQGDEKTTRSSSAKSIFHGMQLLLVQSSICLVFLAITLLFKAIGGPVNTYLYEHIHEGLYEHALMFNNTSDDDATFKSTVATTTTTITAESSPEDALSVSGNTTEVVAPLTGGVITSSYGNRIDPLTGETSVLHHGVDVAADAGTELRAMMRGTVCDVGYEENGYGHYVIIQHSPQYAYVYAHCLDITVQTGQTVNAGDVVAHVGSTGRSTGNHVHIEWRDYGKAVDPMTILPSETYA